MAITFVNVGTIAHADSGNITVTPPASTAAGDICVLIIGSADNVTVSLSGADTYTKKIELNSSTNCRLTVAWARLTAAASNVTVTHTAGDEIWGVIGAYRGCKTSGDPFSDFASQANAGVTTTNTAPTITPLNGDMVIFASAVGEGGTNNGGVQSLSGWSGTNPTFTERADYNDAGLGVHLCPGGFADGTSTGGATGSRTVTLATTAQATANGVGALLALTQDAGGGVGPNPGALLPLTGLQIPGYPVVAPPQPTIGRQPNTEEVVTPLPVSRTVNPFSLAMGPKLYPSQAPIIYPPTQVDVTITQDAAGYLLLVAGTHTFTEDFAHTVGVLNLTAGTHTLTETMVQALTGILNLTAGTHTFGEEFLPAVGVLNLTAGTHTFTEAIAPGAGGVLNLGAGSHVVTGASSSYQFIANHLLFLKRFL